MAPLITLALSIFMIFGFFPLALMTYATLRNKKAAKQLLADETTNDQT